MKRLTGPAALGLMLALAATAGTAGIPAPSGPGPAPPFRASAPFIRDAAGRVRIFHGVNAVWKLKPYYPPSTVYPSPFATSIDQSYFDSRDADFLAGNGFNLVRLGVLWAGVEPQRGAFDAAYLDRVQELVRMLAARGVDVLLDFHQDLYNERFQGEGFPDWATINEVPATNCCGFPGNYFTPAVLRAFDNLWSRKGLRAEYAAAWAHVAARMAGEPNVIGYDLMNEPWAGTQWPTCAGPEGCVAFQNLFLQPFMEASAKAIRAAGGPGIAFWEPDVTNDFGAGDAVGEQWDLVPRVLPRRRARSGAQPRGRSGLPASGDPRVPPAEDGDAAQRLGAAADRVRRVGRPRRHRPGRGRRRREHGRVDVLALRLLVGSDREPERGGHVRGGPVASRLAQAAEGRRADPDLSAGDRRDAAIVLVRRLIARVYHDLLRRPARRDRSHRDLRPGRPARVRRSLRGDARRAGGGHVVARRVAVDAGEHRSRAGDRHRHAGMTDQPTRASLAVFSETRNRSTRPLTASRRSKPSERRRKLSTLAPRPIALDGRNRVTKRTSFPESDTETTGAAWSRP
ncbi:MAG: glycoside hydrolase family 5 protein [Actinobacteria bacterium]|nr:MAG: glycoside hydrolase family 5 protein [Actinomycetota bacterium]